MKRIRLSALLVTLAVGSFAAPAVAAENALTCAALPGLMNRYLKTHFSEPTLDPKFLDRIAERYVDGLDPSKSMLLASEAVSLRKRVKAFAKDVDKNSCGVLLEIQRQQVERQQRMESFVRQMLSDPKLEVDRSIELIVDADKRDYPKNEAERQALRRKFVHFQLANYLASKTKIDEARTKLTHRYELITKRVQEQDEADIYSAFLDAFSSALDPHSAYLSAEALENFRINMQLSLEGIGAVLRSRDGYTLVHEIVPGGAAWRHGVLKPKDKIVAVGQADGDMVDVIDMGLGDVVKLIRGKKGTKVRLTILRQGEKTETLNLTIVRDKIDLKEQAAKLRWEEVERNGKKLKLAVIDLPSFYGGSARGARQSTDDVKKLLREAKAKGAQGLMLDLSRNSGGLLQHAVDITGYFLRRGAVVGVRGPDVRLQVLEDHDEGLEFAGPLVVLVSRASASASEILAGAVKDYSRAVVVGDEKTFGKGSVQNVITLPPGFGALKVTTAMFFRPSGHSTQSTGVGTEIFVPSPLPVDAFGEEHQTYALPPQKIDGFMSASVNYEGERGWKTVPDALLPKLAAASKARVAKDEKLQETLSDREKAAANRGVVKIAEILDGDEKPEEEEEAEAKDDEPSPQSREAVQVLADLVAELQKS